MKPEPKLFELLAKEALGTLAKDETARLAELCASSPASAAMRDRFLAIMASAKSDDTADAPGQSLHRAYRIMAQERSTPAPEATPSLLRLVYDSLKPAVGLRSTASARRQLMLEDDRISVDVFIDQNATGFVLTLLLEGAEPTGVTLVGKAQRTEMTHTAGEWKATAQPGQAHLEIRTPERTIVSEPFEIA